MLLVRVKVFGSIGQAGMMDRRVDGSPYVGNKRECFVCCVMLCYVMRCDVMWLCVCMFGAWCGVRKCIGEKIKKYQSTRITRVDMGCPKIGNGGAVWHKRVRRPGIEPGASRWQRDILPLNQRRLVNMFQHLPPSKTDHASANKHSR